VAPSVIYNTVDNPYAPRSGSRLTGTLPVAGGPLGGTVSYVKPDFEAVFYLPHSRRTALGVRGQVGWIHPFGSTRGLPYYQRHFLGGETQIRGVNIRTVGPVDGDNRALGGNKFVLFNLEYYFDVAGPLRALVFYDAGQSFLEGRSFNLRQLRTSTGVELRFIMPVINVPFRLIYALNPSRDAFQPARTFKFAVGTTF
jgi:outer membrane protein insertion porin family